MGLFIGVVYRQQICHRLLTLLDDILSINTWLACGRITLLFAFLPEHFALTMLTVSEPFCVQLL